MSKRLPPGPNPLSVLGSLPQFRADMLGFCSDLFTKHGDTVSYRFGHLRAIMSRSPDFFRHVLKENPENYKKSFAYDLMRPIFGDGLLIAHGDHWKENRQKMNSAFGPEQLAIYRPKIEKLTDDLILEWSKGERRDAHTDLIMLTLGIIGDCLFGKDIRSYGAHVSQAMLTIMAQVEHQITHPVHLPLWVPSKKHEAYKKAIGTIEEIAQKLIQVVLEHNGAEGNSKTLLARLLPAGEVTPEVRKNLRDQIMTLLITGHDTSANILTFALQILQQHPAMLNQLKEEIDGSSDLNSPLLTSFINEVMRLYPPVWMASRTALSEDSSGEFLIPNKSLVILVPYSLHRHPDYWSEPDTFKLERFMSKTSPEAFAPFGAGPRACVAMTLGMLEMRIILRSIISSLDWKMENSKILVKPTLTLKPDGAVMA
nr:cytochrome P450 [Bdellovibrionales bacterium]